MSETARPWRMVRPGTGKVLATIPIIYDAKDHAVAHVLGGLDCADQIVTAVNAHDSLTARVAELEAALEESKRLLLPWIKKDKPVLSVEEWTRIFDQIDAALAKGGDHQ